MEQLIILAVLVIAGYTFGTIREKNHYRSIIKREKQFLSLPAATVKQVPEGMDDTDARLVTGNAVISIDYFKRILAGLRNIFGGEVSSYETLIDRARREAILRMKEQAGPGTVMILNTRIETSSIGSSANQKNSVGSVEALAYGTALIKK